MVLVTWLSTRIKKFKLVKRLRMFGYRGARRTKVAVRRRVTSSVRAEIKRLKKLLEMCKQEKDKVPIHDMLALRNHQKWYHATETRYNMDVPVWNTLGGMHDPVLRKLDRKVSQKTTKVSQKSAKE